MSSDLDIHKEPRYLELKEELDAKVREFHQYVQAFANEHWRDDGDEAEHMLVFGWVLGIGVTGIHDDGEEFDDVLLETSLALNNYTATGMADAMHTDFRDRAMGRNQEDDE